MAGSSRWSHTYARRRLRFADPGRVRLRFAVTFVVNMAVAVLAAWAVAKATDQISLRVPLPDGSTLEVAYHAAAMMLGAVLALVMMMIPLPPVRRLRGQVLAMFPVLFWLGTLLGTALGRTTFTSIAGLCAFGTAIVLFQRWPKAALMGMPTFFGTFMAVFVQLELRHTGWVLLIALAAGWCVTLVQVLTCPNEASVVRATLQSFDDATDDLLEAIAALLAGAPGRDRARQRVRNARSRVELLALHFDGRLASPLHGLSPRAVDEMHLRVFDREAALNGLAIAALDHDARRADSTEPPIPEIAQVLDHLTRDEVEAVRPALARIVANTTQELLTDPHGETPQAAHRVVLCLDHVVRSWRGVDDIVADATQAAPGPSFQPAVALEPTGVLPGLAAAAQQINAGARPVLGFAAPIFQRAVRMAIALSLASAVGYWISADRWYYGMFGAFSVMMSANGTAEHLRIGVERALGTAIGAVIGVSIVDLFAGHLLWTYVALFALVGVAFYFQRPSDTMTTLGLTVLVAFLYLQMDTYQDAALWDRVLETAAGGAVAVLVAAVVFPLSSRKLTEVAASSAFTGIANAIGTAGEVVSARQPATVLRPATRRAQQAVWTFSECVGTLPFRWTTAEGLSPHDASTMAALGNDTARLIASIEAAGELSEDQRAQLEHGIAHLRTTIVEVGLWRAGAGPRPTIVRSTAVTQLTVGLGTELSSAEVVRRHVAVVHDLRAVEARVLELAGT